MKPMPSIKSISQKLEWAKKKTEALDSYKKSHPDYPELAKEHARENAANIRKHVAETKAQK